MPRPAADELPESSSTAAVDVDSFPGEPVERHLIIGSIKDASSYTSPANGSDERASTASESTLGDLVSGNSEIGVSTHKDSSGDSTPRALPKNTGRHGCFVVDASGLVQTPIHPSVEGILDSDSAASAPWIESIALRGSLAHLGSDLEDASFSNRHHTDNAWVNGNTHRPGPDNAGVPPNSLDTSDNNGINFERIEPLHKAFNSSVSLEWMSERSISTEPDTPLITPSNSSLPIPRSEESSYVDTSLDTPYPSMDFVFEDQMSQAEPSSGSPSVDTSSLNSFAEAKPSGFTPDNLDRTFYPQVPELHSFLDDRTYAEVAGVPSDIESAKATFTLKRWKPLRSSGSRSLSNGPSSSHRVRSANKEGLNNWAAYGTATSMWARVPDPNSRGFESRRDRGHTQIM
ncbi:hypothetical protein RSOLAG1IB_07782 [Rhizoctonia solani AG-1 IB]|uniref:Uncharacterized protein n=1 Tax=Thanatephorus cucumeris (strain AG1-IB / isolate 7/3/14) TaxID=1108050 RepID=A0A0B7FEC6_THACB|nr:hypothetical protein RSOLAG1IB_07782 [Rhizoctonia solani AG-1 IB]